MDDLNVIPMNNNLETPLHDALMPQGYSLETQAVDSMMDNSIAVAELRSNEFFREKTEAELQAMRDFFEASYRAEQQENMDFFDKFGAGYRMGSLSEDIGKTAWELSQAKRLGADKVADELEVLLAKQQWERDQILQPKETDPWSAYNLGQGIQSMMSGMPDIISTEVLGGAALALAGAVLTPATGGASAAITAATFATGRKVLKAKRLIKAGVSTAKAGTLWNRFSQREAQSLYADLLANPDLTEEQRVGYAMRYGALAGAVEVAGAFMGAERLVTSGLKAAGGAIGKRLATPVARWTADAALKNTLRNQIKTEAAQSLAGKITTKIGKGAINLTGAVAGESLEEGAQQGLEQAAVKQVLSGEEPNLPKMGFEGFKNLANVPVELVEGKLSDESIQILNAMGSALLPSLVMAGGGSVLSAASRNASEVSPADTGIISRYRTKNSSLQSSIMTAEKNLGRLTAISNYMASSENSVQHRLTLVDKLVKAGELEANVHFAPEDTEVLVALAESSPSLQNTMTRLGINKAIQEGQKTGTVTVPMQAFAELVAQEELKGSEQGKQLNASGTVALSDASYSRIDRNIRSAKERGQEMLAKPTPKLERKLKGLRRQFKAAGYTKEETDANLEVFTSALATIVQASNSGVTVDELVDEFVFDIETRDWNIKSSNIQDVVAKITGDKRPLLGMFSRYVEKNIKNVSNRETEYSVSHMPGLKPVREGSTVFQAKSYTNLETFLKNMPAEMQARILFDKKRNIWLVSDAAENTHQGMLLEAWASGMYDGFATAGDVSQYFNEDTYSEQFSDGEHDFYRFSAVNYNANNTLEGALEDFEDGHQLFYDVKSSSQSGVLLFVTSQEAIKDTPLKAFVNGHGLYTRKNGRPEVIIAPKKTPKADVSVIDGEVDMGDEVFDESAGMRGPKRIYVAKHADVTTFAHEVMHFVTRSLIEMYNDGSISEAWRKEVDRLYDYFSQQGSMTKDKAGKITMKTEASETLSTGFQRYIEEGVAENTALRRLYAFIKDIAADIWQVLSRGYSSTYRKSPLSDVQTSFYNNVMQAHIDIKNTEYQFGYAPLEKLSGVSDEEYELYTLERKVGRAKSSNSMFKAQRQMVKNRKHAEWLAFYKEEFPKAKAELATKPEYIVMEYVRNNGLLNVASLKLALPRLFTSIPERYFAKAKDKGLTAEELAGKFGPEISIADIANILSTMPSLDVAARRRARTEADRRFLEEHDPAADITPANAMRNMLFIRSLLKETLMIKGEPLSSFPAHYAAWIKEAEAYVNNLTVRNAVDLEKWADMESRMTDDFMSAFTSGNTALAALKADQRAMVNYVLVRSKQIRKMEAQFKRRFKKFYTAPQAKDIRTMDGTTWNLIHTILQEYGFTRRKGRLSANARTQFNNWLEARKGKEYFPYETLANEIELLVNPPKRSSLSVGTFTRLFDLLNIIKEIGEAEMMVFNGQRRDRLDVVAGEIITNIMNLREKKGDKAFAAYGIGSWSRLTVPQLGMLEPLFGEIGMRHLFLQLRNAIVARDNLADTTRTFVADSFIKNNIGALLADKSEFQIGGRTVNNSILLFALQHSGNEHNRKNAIVTLQQYFKDSTFSEVDYIELLNATPKAMRNYVNDLWSMFGNMKKLIDDQTRVATGELIATVEPQAYTLEDGTQMTGGYFPAPKMNKVSVSDPFDNNMDNNLFFPKAGLTKDRVKNETGNLDLSQDALSRWIFQAVNLATMQVAFNDIKHIVEHPQVQEALGKDAGRVTRYITDWVKLAVSPVPPQPKALRMLAKGPTVLFLGFKAVSGLVQLLGTVIGLNEVSTGSLFASAGKLLNVPKYFKITEEMTKRSAFMADRAKKFDSRFFGLMKDQNMLERAGRKYGEPLTSAAMAFVRTFQCMADMVVWDGAYADAKKGGMSDKEASDHADYIVMKTQGDRVQMNTPDGFQGVLRFFQPFMTYILTLNQMGNAAVRARKFKKLGTLVALIVLANMLEAYFKEKDKDWRRELLGKKTKGSDRDFNRRWLNRFLVQTVSTLGDVAIPFAGVGSAASLAATEELLKAASPGYRAYDAGGTPAIEVVQKAAKAITLDEETWKSIYDEDMSLGANLIDFLI